jgi:hypothetical protein
MINDIWRQIACQWKSSVAAQIVPREASCGASVEGAKALFAVIQEECNSGSVGPVERKLKALNLVEFGTAY